MDDKIKQLLQDLGTAINESISGSEDVNRHIQKIRDEGYDLYVVLDATIGLNKQEPDDDHRHSAPAAAVPSTPPREVQFRIDVRDLNFLRSVGIDPTRKVKSARRVEPLAPASEE
ncbi:MAG TPA: hypothetical protein VHK90_09605 [Thermoanaerobaculia bacterium]|nr:hypothetical protein [Thermoanaerobaculia bacterium]